MPRHRIASTRHPVRQRGAVAVTFALLLVVILGFVGLALDGGRLYVNKSELQNAADACALAAAQELAPGVAATAADFERARDAGVHVATRNQRDFQRLAVAPAEVTVDFAGAASALVWALPGAALPTDRIARCTLAPPALSLWFMPVRKIATAEVRAAAAATRQVAGNNCALGPGSCTVAPSLVR